MEESKSRGLAVEKTEKTHAETFETALFGLTIGIFDFKANENSELNSRGAATPFTPPGPGPGAALHLASSFFYQNALCHIFKCNRTLWRAVSSGCRCFALLFRSRPTMPPLSIFCIDFKLIRILVFISCPSVLAGSCPQAPKLHAKL